ncbi:EamA family transporter [Ignavibacteriales bacterium]
MKITPFVLLSYIAICLIWGSTWLVIKIGMESLTPFVSAGARFMVASLVIYLVMKIKNIPLVKDKIAMKIYWIMGFFSFLVPFGLVYWGEQYINSGLASVLFAVYPFCVGIVAHFSLQDEKFSRVKLIGMVTGFLGIIVIFSDSLRINLNFYEVAGMAAVLGSALIQSFVVVLIKKEGTHLHPLSMNFVPMAIASVGFLISGVLFEDISSNRFDLPGIGSVLFLGLFGSIVTFTIYYWLLKKVSVLLMSLIAFITPIIALILGGVVYGEKLTINHLTGSGLVLVGLLISQSELIRKRKITAK